MNFIVERGIKSVGLKLDKNYNLWHQETNITRPTHIVYIHNPSSAKGGCTLPQFAPNSFHPGAQNRTAKR